MGQLCCFPFSRDEEKISKKHKDENTQTALQRERNPLLDKVKDIKAVLALPETRAKIYKEVFGKRLITQNNCQTLPSKT